MKFGEEPGKFEGKTFSLFGEKETTDEYYFFIGKLAERILKEKSDPEILIEKLRHVSSAKSYLWSFLANSGNCSIVEKFYPVLNSSLSVYTKNVEGHLKELSLYKKIWDKRLGTTEEQYHLYMLEIELVNRLYKDEFKKCEYKIALLPHCLRDLSKECKSAPDDFDYVCKGCSKDCYINQVSKLLREHDIHPYIWMEADLKKLFKEQRKKGKSLGVLGIACIPELENGMRKCMNAKVPVIGLPLNTNRCARWFGEFYPNSINMNEMKKLIGESTGS